VTAIDLEVWLTGAPIELDAAARALAAIGTVVYASDRTALAGADIGRCRTYARIHVTTRHRTTVERDGPDPLTSLAA
jgi:hypothetical protein